MLVKNNLVRSLASCIAALALSGTANATNYHLKLVSSGQYAQIDSSNDRILMSATSTSTAQEFEKVSSGSGFAFKAVGGDNDGKYSKEPSGSSRQAVSATSLSDAEIFIENSCDDDGVYFESTSTSKNLKMESDSGLGNGSSGNCSSSANKFQWVEVAVSTVVESSDTYYLQHPSSGNYFSVNSSDQLIANVSNSSSAQAFEKVSSAGGIAIKAVGGSYDGTYALEPSGKSRQELATTDLSSAEIFFENDCGNDQVYLISNTTALNLKVESNNMLGNGSSGSCGSSANELKWVEASESTTTSEPTPTATSNLDPSKFPSDNFDLGTWNLGIPIDRGDGISTTISVADLNDDYQHSEYFYTDNSTGGMVFKCTIEGSKTSESAPYTRSEFREMLRGTDTDIDTKGVNKNNWVFGSASIDTQIDAGGVNGNMKATLQIDHVTSTGNSSQQGRVIIGQIHANSNEPVRLYYRKLANHTKGSIYFAHEPASGYGSEQWVEMIGERSSSASEPSDGIELGEKFSYEIDVTGSILTVTIIRDGKDDIVEDLDMVNSGYSESDRYQYFKAGVYNQNNTGDDDDYVQATFFNLEKSHD